jgi:hypothetical protein
MNSIKPTDSSSENYAEQIKAWQEAFSFSQEVKKYVNELNNMIVLAGGKNTSAEFKLKLNNLIEELKSVVSSKKFNTIMESVKPDIDRNENYDEKMKLWQKAFNFTEKLEEFIEALEKEDKNKEGESNVSEEEEGHPIRCKLNSSGELDSNPFTLESSSSTSVDNVDIGQPKWSHKWPSHKTTLTWKFVNHTSDIELAYWQRRAATTAFRTISLLIPRKFRFEKNENIETDINIEFTHDTSVFSKPGDLAQAVLYHPGNPPGTNGSIQFNDNYFFTPFGDALPAHIVDPIHYTEGETNPNETLKMLGTEPFLHILMHEICHMMGYRHDTNSPESMMFPFVKKGQVGGEINPDAFIWTEEDIKRWESGYGLRSLDSSMLNRLRVRRLHGRFKKGIQYRVAV